jgi:hypothetical protein
VGRLAAVLALVLGTIFGLSWHEASQAYPGPDGYDSGSCYAYTGLKLGVSNWNTGTGQTVAVDVADNSTKVNMVRVTWDGPVSDFTVTTVARTRGCGCSRPTGRAATSTSTGRCSHG